MIEGITIAKEQGLYQDTIAKNRIHDLALLSILILGMSVFKNITKRPQRGIIRRILFVRGEFQQNVRFVFQNRGNDE